MNTHRDATIFSFGGIHLRSRDIIICVALLCWAVFGIVLIHVNKTYALSNVPATVTVLDVNTATAVQAEVPQPSTSDSVSQASTATSGTPSPKQCSKGSYAQPAQIPLAAGQSGLVQVVDSPRYYQVYGNDASQVYQQISRCTPFGSGSTGYAAVTDYALSWKYSYASGNGVCRVTNAAVSLHVAQTYPQWQNSLSATPGYAARWQAFMSNLVTHENGHRDLNISYANKILNDLNTLTAAGCDELQQAANNSVNANVAALNRAHDGYDGSTNHGATQGASVPR